MNKEDLSPNLQGLLTFIEGHASEEIPKRGTFDPYGILLKRRESERVLVFLEALDDSDEGLKGLPAKSMARQIEDQIRLFRDDPALEAAAVVQDASLRSPEGGEEQDVVMAWLDDRGRQRVRIVLEYNIRGGAFQVKRTVIELRDRLFLNSLTPDAGTTVE
jgi:hypothetical protein